MTQSGRLYVIGVDEAGYGPNLGPLALGASIWQVPEAIDLTSFAVQLEPHFQAKRWQGSDRKPFVPLGDSKQLYQSGGSTDSLGIGVISLLQNARSSPAIAAPCLWSELLQHCNCLKLQPRVHQELLPWYTELTALPSMPWRDAATMFAGIAKQGLADLDIDFEGFQARLVDELLFNQGLKQFGSKGKLLSLTTLQLVKDVMECLTMRDVVGIEVYCDRHGGRSKYLELLHSLFDDLFFWIESETPKESCYRAEWKGCPLRIRFTVGGDRFPPTAAASMIAKWLREVSMDHFNAFWQKRITSLKPTAGYPVDAKRFIHDLKAADVWSSGLSLPSLETIWRRA